MVSLMDNQDLVCYLVTKHSLWKGKYKRIFSFGTNGVTTYDPESLEITNRWAYGDIVSIKRGNVDFRFTITGRKEGATKVETMIFSTEHRSELLSVASIFRHNFSEKCDIVRCEAVKYHWSGTRLPVLLDMTSTSVNQLDTATNTVLASYLYKDIDTIYELSDIIGGFIIVTKQFGRMHLFICSNRGGIINKIQTNAHHYLGIEIRTQNKPTSLEYFLNNRLGKFSGDEHTTSLLEFNVDKVGSKRHNDSVHRLLCLTQSCILERDPETYHIVSIRPLENIFAFVRDFDNPRQFAIEYKDTEFSNSRTYDGPNRDSILATLLDGARGAGNKNVHVKMKPTNRGKRLYPYYSLTEEEVETMHLKLIKNSAGKKGVTDVIERFNCNIPYSGLRHSVTQDGLFKENKERPILESLQALCMKPNDVESLCDEELESLYYAVRRLLASKSGFSGFSQIVGFRENLGIIVLEGVKRNNEAITHAAVDMICALMHPMHDEYDIKQEQLNKSSLLANSNFLNGLLDKWTQHVNSDTGALVVSAMLDLLTFALCTPYSETTEGRHFDSLLEMVAHRGRSLFKHFQHPCMTIVKGASLIMRAIIEEGEPEVAAKMQELALNEGALPRHLITALFTSKNDHQKFAQCKLSKQLVGLWLTNNLNGNNLLKRMLPDGLLSYLHSTEEAPVLFDESDPNIRDNLKLAQDHASKNLQSSQFLSFEKQFRLIEKHFEDTLIHWGTRLGFEKRRDKVKMAPVVLRKSRHRIKVSLNWNLFYYQFNRDHALPNLIWNHKTRDELRNALEKEIRAFDTDREVSRGNLIAWNYSEFEVLYPSLKDQICIDGYYIKILLDSEQAPDSLNPIAETFFYNLYHRFLLSTSTEMRCMCLHALAIVYGHFHGRIQHFSDSKYFINTLLMTYDRNERDRIILFLHKLSFCKDNIKYIIDSGGIPVLVELMTLAHLHRTRAVIPTQSNVIEFKPNEYNDEEEKEWHFQNRHSKKTSEEEVSFKEMKSLFGRDVIDKESKVWAQGLQNWTQMQNVSQLKWTLLATGNAVMNESELATLILNMLIKMIEYYPSRNEENAIIWPISRLKRILSSNHCLPHIVQLLLTFDPVIVEKVATLLCLIAQDNVITPKLYMTGVFYFILMYNGSNVLPIAKFLQLTHTKQAFRGDEGQTMELMQRSILGQLLPEAMVNYLENHGAEKFAQIFLGEYDTPEVIWSSEMRLLLIQKIAAHIADFTPRLWSNNKALYHHAIIPAIRFPQLVNELFCNIFYLRHLCDSSRFPDWPISDPVNVLRDVLEAWKFEVEKKPLAMSIDEAYDILEIPRGQHHDETTVRKAYYRLAQKYHPDKNTEGREKFESVNKAYDFLCSRRVWMDIGVNLNNIILIIKTQSILFSRYSSVLQPYKYAGYNQLIKTIQLEIDDDLLFSRRTFLLPSAIELIYYTIDCTSLNCEEFNRENGFQVTAAAFSRCVSMLCESSSESDFGPQVCLYCTKCFTIAAKFESCRSTFNSLPNLVSDLLRILHFKGLSKLCCAVVECISALAADPNLQLKLLQSGVLWYIISFLFLYDYTLEECGIENALDANLQEGFNDLAKLSARACKTLVETDHFENNSCNEKVHTILSKLLTTYTANLLINEEPEEVLKILLSNCETPYFLWNNMTRAELLEYLDKQKSLHNEEFSEIVDFSYSIHKNELIVGNIFIRIYNEQPAYPIKNPKEFIVELLDYLKHCYQLITSSNSDNSTHIVMLLTSLYNVIYSNLGVELQCIGNFKILFNLLGVESSKNIQMKVLLILKLVTRNQECINDLALCGMLIQLLFSLHTLIEFRILILDSLHGLITSTSVVKEIFSKGGTFYLLNVLLNSNDLDTQIKAAEILGRLMDDKVSGPRVKLSLLNLIPAVVCDVMRDTPQAAINLLETYQETPEIIWTEESRRHLTKVVSEHIKTQYELQKENPNISPQAPDIGSSDLDSCSELIIGGVYVRLFNLNPGWNLRKPLVFLTELFDILLKQMNKQQDDCLDVVGTALINLLNFHPKMVDQLPSLGHVPRMFTLWRVPNLTASELIFKILNHLFMSEVCVDSLIRVVDCLLPIKNALTAHPELMNSGCDTLFKLFSFKNDILIKQAVEVSLVTFLLNQLEGNLVGIDNPSRTKAIIVKTLKKMNESINYNSVLSSILEKSSAWSSYSEQNHDLFITESANIPYITDGPAGCSGYLTHTTSQNMPSSPPPVSKEE